jgi:hypothetical protein
MAKGLADNVGKSVVKSSEYPASIEGNYRLIRNDSVNAQSIAESGFKATAELADTYGEILALEDTTTLAYHRQNLPDKLGYIGNSLNAKFTGFSVHSVLLYAPEEKQTIGLIDQHRWVRNKAGFGSRKNNQKRPYKEKESFKWELASRNVSARLGDKFQACISVCDREADIIEYLSYKYEHHQRFVVRAKSNRPLSDGGRLFDSLATETLAGEYDIDIPQRGGRKARRATLSIQYAKLMVQAPERKQAIYPQMSLYAVTCKELNSDSEAPLHWCLLTTEKVENAAQARKIEGYYEARWKVELFHKVWKSEGTNVESLKMHQFESLEKVAVVHAFIACRLMQLKDMGDSPAGNDAPCTLCLTPAQWQLLYKAMYKKRPDNSATPSIKWAYQSLGKLAGWYDSKRTGRLSWKTLSEGLAKLDNMMEAIELLKM